MEDLVWVCFLLVNGKHIRGVAQRRLKCMLTTLVLTGVLGGIAGLVAFEAICEGIGCSSKLHDRYHE